MDNIKEVILYIDNNKGYKGVDAASELLNRWSELKDPIVIPDDHSKRPLFAFTGNHDFQMEGTKTHVSFLVKESYFNKISSIIFDIVDTFDELGVSFKRIGIISSNYYPKSCIEKAKQIYLANGAIDEEVEELNLSWYRKLNVSNGYINAWERVITDTSAFDELLIQFDFNTPIDVKVELDMRTIKEFLKVSEEHMKRRNKFDL